VLTTAASAWRHRCPQSHTPRGPHTSSQTTARPRKSFAQAVSNASQRFYSRFFVPGSKGHRRFEATGIARNTLPNIPVFCVKSCSWGRVAHSARTANKDYGSSVLRSALHTSSPWPHWPSESSPGKRALTLGAWPEIKPFAFILRGSSQTAVSHNLSPGLVKHFGDKFPFKILLCFHFSVWFSFFQDSEKPAESTDQRWHRLSRNTQRLV